MLRERWVPPLLQNLQQGLLNQSIDDAGHAELSDPAIRLGYFDPLNAAIMAALDWRLGAAARVKRLTLLLLVSAGD